MFKKCKVVMLPTEKATSIIKNLKDNSLSFGKILGPQFIRYGEEGQHLYALSDDKIEENDWVIPNDLEFAFRPWQFKQAPCPLPFWGCRDNCKKIIATTDTLESEELGLIFRIPRMSGSFIKKYCELGGINEVMVEYEDKGYQKRTNPEEIKPLKHQYTWIENIQLKVAPDNTITIKRVKDSWNREEVNELLIRLLEECKINMVIGTSVYVDNKGRNWIKENL